MRIITHVNQALKQKSSNVAILLNDADVVVFVLYYLYYIDKYVREGLKKCAATGDPTRYLPMDIMYEKLGANLCSALLKAHILTKCKITGKFGIKKSAMKLKPDTFLSAFDSTDKINFLRQSKEYLVKVASPATKFATFDELRFKNYTGKTTSFINVPSNSISTKGHLCRCFFIIQVESSILNKTGRYPNPCNFG